MVRLSVLLGLLGILVLGAVVIAYEPLPNDPFINPDANACYEGGSMEGRCGIYDYEGNGLVDDEERDWDFVCGWYLIRFEAGIFTPWQMPVECSSLLPLNKRVPRQLPDLIPGPMPEPELICEVADEDFDTFNIPAGQPMLLEIRMHDLCGDELIDTVEITNTQLVQVYVAPLPSLTPVFITCMQPGDQFLVEGFYIRRGLLASFRAEGLCLTPSTAI